MKQGELIKLINYILNQGIKAIKNNTSESNFAIDYVAICAKNKAEFNELIKVTESLGKKVAMGIAKTGVTFKLNKAIETKAGPVEFVKIRRPDPTRPQRGAPDFRVKNYQSFKKKYLMKSGNFALIIRKEFEMLELKGIDVLVYFPSKAAKSRLVKAVK